MNLMLDYASLAILFVVLLILIFGLIALHDIPYEIAKKRNHPHADAIHIAGWVSLFFLHVILLVSLDMGSHVRRREAKLVRC